MKGQRLFTQTSFYCAPLLAAEKIDVIMALNMTDEEAVMVEDCEEKETFHIYLLSIVYSILAVSGRERGSTSGYILRFCRL